MIIYTHNNLKIVETRSDKPASDWTGKAEFVIDERNPDNAELIFKIKQLVPYFDYVVDAEGNLIDVTKNNVVIPDPEPEHNIVEDANYDDLARAIQEGVNEV